MTFYVIIFILCAIFAFITTYLKDEKQKRVIEIGMLIFLIFVSGTRYYIGGWDYKIYQTVFDTVPTLGNFHFDTIREVYGTFGMESGYLFYNSMIKTVGLNFFGFTLINSAVFYTVLYIAVRKYTNNFMYFLIIFMYKMFVFDTFVSMRQSIAIVIFIFAIQFIENRKLIKYMLACLLAMTFHISSIILIPLYFIKNIKIGKRVILILNAVFFVFLILNITGIYTFNPSNFLGSVFTDQVYQDKTENYFDTSKAGVSLLNVIEYYAITILLLMTYDKEKDQKDIFIKLFLILLPIFTLFRSFEVIIRMRDFFIISYVVILERYMDRNKRWGKDVIYMLTAAVCFIAFYRYIYFYDDGSLMPYHSYLSEDVSIFQEK